MAKRHSHESIYPVKSVSWKSIPSTGKGDPQIYFLAEIDVRSDLDLCSSTEGIEADYERLFPSLAEIAKKALQANVKKAALMPRRSSRLSKS